MRQAVSDEALAQAEQDARTIELKTMDPAVYDSLPPDLKTRHDPDYVIP